MSILWRNEHDQNHPDEIASLMAQRGGHARDYAPSDRQRLAELAGEVAEVCAAMGDVESIAQQQSYTVTTTAFAQFRLRLLKALREAQR